MERNGWRVIAIGLVIAVAFCTSAFIANATGEGILSWLFALGSFGGLIVVAVGMVMIGKARGRWTPPI